MLKIFYDWGDKDDIASNLVAEASNRLDVGEFQLFQLSYEAWYGEEMEPKRLETAFFGYLMKDEVPPWARHYARKIIEQDDAGNLDYRDPHYHRFDPRSMRTDSTQSGLLKVGVVLLIVVAFLGASMILMHGKSLDDFPCQFPPCYRSY